MKLVIIESPYRGKNGTTPEVELSLEYVRAAMLDCLKRGEAPYASHALYTQPGVLNDKHSNDRKLGIDAGLAWGLKADLTVVYSDLGVSMGMAYGIEAAKTAGRPVEWRSLGVEWQKRGLE